jgi:hypothetical protein
MVRTRVLASKAGVTAEKRSDTPLDLRPRQAANAVDLCNRRLVRRRIRNDQHVAAAVEHDPCIGLEASLGC